MGIDVIKALGGLIEGLDVNQIVMEKIIPNERQQLRMREYMTKGIVEFIYFDEDGKKIQTSGTLKDEYMPDKKYKPQDDYDVGCFIYWDLQSNDWREFRWDRFVKVIKK